MIVSKRASCLFGLGVWVAAACSATDDVSESEALERCADVREHAIHLQLASASEHGAALTPEVADAHRAAMRASLGEQYLVSCRDRGAAWAECALRAGDAEAMDACEGKQ